MLRSALLVDPDADRLDLLTKEIGEAAEVTSCVDFQSARDCLLTTSPDFLISHLRLGAYNGLHLAIWPPTRASRRGVSSTTSLSMFTWRSRRN